MLHLIGGNDSAWNCSSVLAPMNKKLSTMLSAISNSFANLFAATTAAALKAVTSGEDSFNNVVSSLILLIKPNYIYLHLNY